VHEHPTLSFFKVFRQRPGTSEGSFFRYLDLISLVVVPNLEITTRIGTLSVWLACRIEAQLVTLVTINDFTATNSFPETFYSSTRQSTIRNGPPYIELFKSDVPQAPFKGPTEHALHRPLDAIKFLLQKLAYSPAELGLGGQRYGVYRCQHWGWLGRSRDPIYQAELHWYVQRQA